MMIALSNAHVWGNDIGDDVIQPLKPTGELIEAGRVVEIMALLETSKVVRPDAFHVVAHLSPVNNPKRRISRVLQPSTCKIILFICVKLPKQKSGSQAQFPIHQQGITFNANHPVERGNHIFCYRGRYTLDPSELPGEWGGLLSAQTVNTVPSNTPPEIAATTIGGLESAAIANGVACAIVLSLDQIFDVI